jgi:hypothetical protein
VANAIILSINLDWPLDAQNDVPLFARKAFHKDIIWKKPRTVNDDIWTFNSQSSSQCETFHLDHAGFILVISLSSQS